MEKRVLPKWLVKTQHGSWEPEIFISGIVLIGLIQLPEYLTEFRFYFSREIFGLSTDIDNLIAVLTTGIYWMIFGLGLHLFIRGIWIGLVGLSYVFPNGINKDRLGYAQKFEKVVDNIPDVTEQVIKLEKISSSIFSINYLMFMSILGAYFFIVLAIVFPVYIFILFTDFTVTEAFVEDSNLSKVIAIYGRTLSTLGLIYMFDFLSLGLIKRIKYVNVVYYPIYRFISLVTFSKLYRNIYYLLISNFKKWKVITFLILFTTITIAIIFQNAGRDSVASNLSQLEFYGGGWENTVSISNYDNMNDGIQHVQATIQSDIISTNSLRLFVSDRSNFNDSIRAVCDKTIEKVESDEYKLACLKNFFKVSLDDSLINTHQWFFHKHLNTGNRGIITYIDISTLKNGLHQVKVDLNWGAENTSYAKIPFYVEH